MAATVTATGTAGPGLTVTAEVFTNVTNVNFSADGRNMLSFQQDDGQVKEIAITAATTITATKSGSTYTFTVS